MFGNISLSVINQYNMFLSDGVTEINGCMFKLNHIHVLRSTEVKLLMSTDVLMLVQVSNRADQNRNYNVSLKSAGLYFIYFFITHFFQTPVNSRNKL